jgi:hypothetical protein
MSENTGIPTRNLVLVRGTLSGPPRPRELPSGSLVVAYDVTVPRPDGSRADTVPVSWFDPPSAATALDAGEEVVVLGRVSRRFFRQAGGTGSRTDVVADAVLPLRRKAQARRVMDQAADTVTAMREDVT